MAKAAFGDFGDESKAEMVRIKSLKEGSVIVKGSVEAENKDQQDQIFSNLESNLKGEQTLMGYGIIAASYEKKVGGETPVDEGGQDNHS